MKILITGSSGHLGEALVRTLRPHHQVIGIDITPSPFTAKVGSIADRNFVHECITTAGGVEVMLHTATLHKPHVISHSYSDFISTNVTGTLNLLEEAAAAGVKSFVFSSTTSVYSSLVLSAAASGGVTLVTEELHPKPKNIYGVTKIAAENLCELFHQIHKLPCIVLRISRFFPEDDDEESIRESYQDGNVKANEFLYRRVDIEDVVSAHLLAMEKAKQADFGFRKYIITATTPFDSEDLAELATDAPKVLKRKFPDYEEKFGLDGKGWKMFPTIDRVYVNHLARKELGWEPKFDFSHVLRCLEAGVDPRSDMAKAIGKKMYHPKIESGLLANH